MEGKENETYFKKELDLFADELFSYLLPRRLGVSYEGSAQRSPDVMNHFTADIGKSVLVTCFRDQEGLWKMFTEDFPIFRKDPETFELYLSTKAHNVTRTDNDILEIVYMMGAMILELMNFCFLQDLHDLSNVSDIKPYIRCYKKLFLEDLQGPFFSEGGWQALRRRALLSSISYDKMKTETFIATLCIDWLKRFDRKINLDSYKDGDFSDNRPEGSALVSQFNTENLVDVFIPKEQIHQASNLPSQVHAGSMVGLSGHQFRSKSNIDNTRDSLQVALAEDLPKYHVSPGNKVSDQPSLTKSRKSSAKSRKSSPKSRIRYTVKQIRVKAEDAKCVSGKKAYVIERFIKQILRTRDEDGLRIQKLFNDPKLMICLVKDVEFFQLITLTTDDPLNKPDNSSILAIALRILGLPYECVNLSPSDLLNIPESSDASIGKNPVSEALKKQTTSSLYSSIYNGLYKIRRASENQILAVILRLDKSIKQIRNRIAEEKSRSREVKSVAEQTITATRSAPDAKTEVGKSENIGSSLFKGSHGPQSPKNIDKMDAASIGEHQLPESMAGLSISSSLQTSPKDGKDSKRSPKEFSSIDEETVMQRYLWLLSLRGEEMLSLVIEICNLPEDPIPERREHFLRGVNALFDYYEQCRQVILLRGGVLVEVMQELESIRLEEMDSCFVSKSPKDVDASPETTASSKYIAEDKKSLSASLTEVSESTDTLPLETESPPNVDFLQSSAMIDDAINMIEKFRMSLPKPTSTDMSRKSNKGDETLIKSQSGESESSAPSNKETRTVYKVFGDYDSTRSREPSSLLEKVPAQSSKYEEITEECGYRSPSDLSDASPVKGLQFQQCPVEKETAAKSKNKKKRNKGKKKK